MTEVVVVTERVVEVVEVAPSGVVVELSAQRGPQGIVALSASTPAPVGAAAVGVDTEASHADHVHALPAVGIAGTYTKVTTDANGRVSAGTTLAEVDIPALSPSKVTGTAVITSDSRLSDARTPTAHAASHAAAGGDPLTISPSQVTGTAVVTADARLSDARTPLTHSHAESDVTSLVTDLGLKAPIASPTFTGTVTAPTVVPSSATPPTNGLFLPAANAVGLATNGTERLRIDANGLITGAGTSLGAWTTYTPVISGSTWTLGDGVASGAYRQIGKHVTVRFSITFGGTSTYGTASILISLPVNAKTGLTPVGRLLYHDVSAGAYYFGVADTNDAAGTLNPRCEKADVAFNKLDFLVSTAPFTWANGDRILGQLIYEAA